MLATGLFGPAVTLAADAPTPASARDEILVRFRANATAAQRRALTQDLDLTVVRSSHTGRTAVVRGKGVSPATVRRLLASDSRVAAVGHNYRRELAADPTDEQYFRYGGVSTARGRRSAVSTRRRASPTSTSMVSRRSASRRASRRSSSR